MEEKKIDLSIIILSYNSKNDLERLLPSIDGSAGAVNFETIIIDNGSTDGTPDWLAKNFQGRKNFLLIRNVNSGFAKGNNLGIKVAKGEYLLILNPDTKLEINTLSVMLGFMRSHPGVGIGTCKVVLPNGRLDLACRRKFPNLRNSFERLFLLNKKDYNLLNTDENQSQEIDSCMGAFMMMHRLPTTHYPLPTIFDEDFFMYGEDLDLCWRVKEAGFKVWYYPETFITHYKGSSSAKTPFKALKWFHDAMWIFYDKHYAKNYPIVFSWLVWFGIYLRFIGLVVINIFKSKPKVSG